MKDRTVDAQDIVARVAPMPEGKHPRECEVQGCIEPFRVRFSFDRHFQALFLCQRHAGEIGRALVSASEAPDPKPKPAWWESNQRKNRRRNLMNDDEADTLRQEHRNTMQRNAVLGTKLERLMNAVRGFLTNESELTKDAMREQLRRAESSDSGGMTGHEASTGGRINDADTLDRRPEPG